MNQLPYQQTQNALIQNQNQTSLYPIQPIEIPQNNIIQDNINAVQYKNLLEELSQSASAEIERGPQTNKECLEDMLGCKNNKTFIINLTTKNGTRQAFACKENIGTCQRCVVYHWNGSQSTYTYNNLSVYRNGDRLRMSTPSVPVPIYVSSVKEAYLIWLE